MTAYGDEGERYINEYKDICARAEKLYEKLPTDKQASFFELALYPIRTATNMAIDYVQTDRANLYVAKTEVRRLISMLKKLIMRLSKSIRICLLQLYAGRQVE